jgi:hypothetical protein
MNRFGFQLIVGLLALVLVAGAGMYGYNLGVARGVAESARLVVQAPAAPGTGVPVVAFWPHPWGFGFGFFPFFFPLFPIFFILFFVFVTRALFWRRGMHGGCCGYPRTPPAETKA